MIIRKGDEMKRFAIWGTAAVGEKVYHLLKKQSEIQVVCFTDRDTRKQTEKFGN